MTLHEISGSHISHIGFDAGELMVTFQAGKTYVYQGVTEQMFTDFLNAESKGKHLRTMGLGKHVKVFDGLPAADVVPAEQQPIAETVIEEVQQAEAVIAQAGPEELNPEAREIALRNEASTNKEKALSLKVIDEATFIEAGEFGKSLKALESKIETHYAEAIKKAHEAHKAMISLRDKDLVPVKEALSVIRATMNTYAQEQKRIQDENDRKARIKAEEEANEKRKKLEAQAEKAIDKGQEEKAEQLMETAAAVYVQPVFIEPVLAKTVQTASGNITQAKELKVTVTDMNLFLKTLCEKNPGAVASIVKIGDGPLKSFVKSNGLKSYPGLGILETVGVRI